MAHAAASGICRSAGSKEGGTTTWRRTKNCGLRITRPEPGSFACARLLALAVALSATATPSPAPRCSAARTTGPPSSPTRSAPPASAPLGRTRPPVSACSSSPAATESPARQGPSPSAPSSRAARSAATSRARSPTPTSVATPWSSSTSGRSSSSPSRERQGQRRGAGSWRQPSSRPSATTAAVVFLSDSPGCVAGPILAAVQILDARGRNITPWATRWSSGATEWLVAAAVDGRPRAAAPIRDRPGRLP